MERYWIIDKILFQIKGLRMYLQAPISMTNRGNGFWVISCLENYIKLKFRSWSLDAKCNSRLVSLYSKCIFYTKTEFIYMEKMSFSYFEYASWNISFTPFDLQQSQTSYQILYLHSQSCVDYVWKRTFDIHCVQRNNSVEY